MVTNAKDASYFNHPLEAVYGRSAFMIQQIMWFLWSNHKLDQRVFSWQLVLDQPIFQAFWWSPQIIRCLRCIIKDLESTEIFSV